METQQINELEEAITVDLKVLKPAPKGILSDEFLEPYKTKIPPFGPLGYVTHKRTYARRSKKDNRTEEWWETCRREIEGIHSLGCKFTEEEAQQFYDDIFNLKCSFSGRSKWQLGTKTVETLGGSSLCNCWGVVIDNSKAFTFTFDQLMLGGGVGFNLQREYVYQLPKIKRGVKITRLDTNDADLIVSDKREGWVELLSRVLDSWFVTGKGFTYSTVCIRGKGAPIKGFGGVASGPEELVLGIEDICSIFRNRQGKKLRPIDCLDIMNIIGRIVVSGNVRRSALIGLGDHDDQQFLNAKRWDLFEIPNWRKYSNNSIVCNDINVLPESFWESFTINPETKMARGECYGLINLNLARTRGRALDSHRVDPEAKVPNPCAEIILSPTENTGEGESCNLIEMFLPRIDSIEEFVRIAKLCYRVVKTVAAQPYHWPETEKIVHKNMRLGISVTGIAQWYPMVGEKDSGRWLDTCYKALEKEDERYSQECGYPLSIRLTTTKPSGTLSLLPGVTPGVHPAYSPFYIRRIRFASKDLLIPELRSRGYPIEPQMQFDGSLDHETLVVSFPVKAPENAVCAKDMSAVKQMELVKLMNTYWSDNSTSVTVYYREHELPEIRQWLKENYNGYIKSISFMLHSEHGFAQAPYEEISEEQYEDMSKKITPITFLDIQDVGCEFDRSQSECANGACPVI